MKLIAIITARGGSKTIKNKNIKDRKKSLVEFTFKELNKIFIKDKYILTDSKKLRKSLKGIVLQIMLGQNLSR